ncbi:MAG: efflux RND transporter periplasmic adaptor subunit [Burkholderiales bacterium]|uniref:Efflux RND transporter periplasmic adaptor subunit n=1 Tax=Ottowia pentelensis TaxID=511108 RepID=A0ABV6PP92_9BURK|nr:efflux RND transporter periplasmic adaptor subunit [Burkholderiales bacterium]MBS0401773.1 efflux RND transporter periplasmic adaptor subunit [Pseudomonadota bacterium]
MTRRALTTLIVLLALLALLAAAALAWRGIRPRQAVQQAQSAPAPAPVIELRALDLATVQPRELALEVPLSGTLRAVHSAMVKARVPGELQGLTLREGDRVQAGQVIARVESTEYDDRLRQAQQQASAAQAQVDIAQRQYDNNRALVDQGFISRTALDASAASLDAARANLRAAQAGAGVARKSVADTVLRAPIGGQIAQRLAQPGERVAPDTRIVEIVDASQLELEAALSPADSVAVRVGQRATLQVEGASVPVVATVARINPSTQAGSRSVMVYLTVQPAPGLRQGLFAQGQLAVGQERALAVPLAAVRTDKPQPYVQVVEGEGEQARIAHRTVTPGARAAAEGETWVAVTGLAAGDRVLRAAAGALRAGTRVRLVAGAAS